MTIVIKAKATRRERNKAAVRSRIMTAAIGLFGRHGIDEVTVDQIAEAADIGKGTVYNYFQTKEDIIVAFMVDLERKVQARARKFAASDLPPEGILADFIRVQFRLKRRYYKFVRVFLGQMFLRTGQFLPYMLEMQKVIDPPLEDLFRRLQDRGLVRKDVSLPEIIQAFKTVHLGLTSVWAVEGPPFRQTEGAVEQAARLFWEGMRAL